MFLIKNFIDVSKNKVEYFKMLLITIGINALMVLIPLFQKDIIDMISKSLLPENKLLLLFVFGLLLIILTFLESYLLIKAQLRIQKNISMTLLNSLSKKDNFVIKTRGSGAFMNSVFGDSEQISMMAGSMNYFMGLAYIITTILILAITGSWMIYFPIIILISYILVFLILAVIGKKQSQYFKDSREEIFKLNPKTLEFIENRRTIINSGSFETYLGEIDKSMDTRDEFFKKSMLASKLSLSLIDSVKNIDLIILFILSMLMIVGGKLELSDFVAMVAYLPTTFLPLYFLKDLKDNKAKIEMIYDRNKESYEAKASYSFPKDTSVSINKVSLFYDDKPILDGISLDLDKIYGLVGLSGEGKTSIFKLLLGDLLPESGNVTYGGAHISDFNLGLRYSLYKIYFQENNIFDSSLKENIVLRKTPLSADEFYQIKEEIIKEFKAIKAGNFDISDDLLLDIVDIKGLSEGEKEKVLSKVFSPMEDSTIKLLADIKVNKNYYIEEKYQQIVSDLGLNYLEGRDFGQRGSNISGGEKNKVSLARILLLESDLPYLIDEPFTSVDLLSERQSLLVLKKYLAGQRGIIISHKLDLLNTLSDELIVLENGKIAASGCHKDLLGQSKLYKDLYGEYQSRSID